MATIYAIPQPFQQQESSLSMMFGLVMAVLLGTLLALIGLPALLNSTSPDTDGGTPTTRVDVSIPTPTQPTPSPSTPYTP